MELLQRAFWPPCMKPSHIAVGNHSIWGRYMYKMKMHECILFWFSLYQTVDPWLFRFPRGRIGMDDNMGEKCSAVVCVPPESCLHARGWAGEPQLVHTVDGEVILLSGSWEGVTSAFRSSGRMRLTLAHTQPPAVTSDGPTEAKWVIGTLASAWLHNAILCAPLISPPLGCGNY